MDGDFKYIRFWKSRHKWALYSSHMNPIIGDGLSGYAGGISKGFTLFLFFDRVVPGCCVELEGLKPFVVLDSELQFFSQEFTSVVLLGVRMLSVVE